MSSSRTPALLVLADGRVFRGRAVGATGTTLGEAVFTTALTGYQETLTDPSYHRQIIVATAPQIGNTGWNDEDSESHNGKIWAAGLVIRDLSRSVSNWRAARSLPEEMEKQGLIGIQGIDTRALVRHLRDQGAVAAGIFSGEAAERPVEEFIAEVAAQPTMVGSNLAVEASTDEVYVVEPEGEARYTVLAYDMGIKTNTPSNFASRGVRTVVVPAESPVEPLLEQYEPDGVFISNGPGDPATADVMVQQVQTVLERKIPLFGICFGNQILGRALGMDTYKLKFGHRGINQPVQDRETGAVAITAHNHGFAVDLPIEGEHIAPHDDGRYGRVVVSHVGLNDGVVEGLRCLDRPAYSVQYHPEAAGGPHDASPLFDRLAELAVAHRAASASKES